MGEATSRRCHVCGDAARHRHFGALSCVSCKTFFRRAVVKGFMPQCRDKGQCKITVTLRKACQHCRFAKCISVGMIPQLVLTNDSGSVKQVAIANISSPITDTLEFQNSLTDDELVLVKGLIAQFQRIACDIPMIIDEEFSNLAVLSVGKLRTAHLVNAIPEITWLTPRDQKALLRSAVIQVSWLRYSVVGSNIFNAMARQNKTDATCWPKHPKQVARCLSPVFVSLLSNTTRLLAEVPLDEPIVILLTAAMYFSVEVPDLQEACKIAAIQRRYLAILRKYLQWRRGPEQAELLYAKLLNIMVVFRSMNSGYDSLHHHVWLEKNELQFLNSQLGEYSPYTHYSIEERDRGFTHLRSGNHEFPDRDFPEEFNAIDTTLTKFMNVIRVNSKVQGQEDSHDLFELIESLDVGM